MTIGSDLLATCADHGVIVTLDGGKLVVDAPDTPEADEALGLVARLKSDVVRALEPRSRAANWQRFDALVALDQRERERGR